MVWLSIVRWKALKDYFLDKIDVYMYNIALPEEQWAAALEDSVLHDPWPATLEMPLVVE